MTGLFLRVLRGGRWKAIEVEYLTLVEREAALEGKTNEELIRWIHILCKSVKAGEGS